MATKRPREEGSPSEPTQIDLLQLKMLVQLTGTMLRQPDASLVRSDSPTYCALLQSRREGRTKFPGKRKQSNLKFEKVQRPSAGAGIEATQAQIAYEKAWTELAQAYLKAREMLEELCPSDYSVDWPV